MDKINIGNAKEPAKTGENVTVEINGQSIAVQAGNEINSSKIVVVGDKAFSASSPRTIKDNSKVKKKRTKKKKVAVAYPFKLAVVANDEIYKGGDTSLIVISNLEGIGLMAIASDSLVGFRNTGINKNDWIVLIKVNEGGIKVYDAKINEINTYNIPESLSSRFDYVGGDLYLTPAYLLYNYLDSPNNNIISEVYGGGNGFLSNYNVRDIWDDSYNGEDLTYDSEIETRYTLFNPTQIINYRETRNINTSETEQALYADETKQKILTAITSTINIDVEFNLIRTERIEAYVYDTLSVGTKTITHNFTENGTFNTEFSNYRGTPSLFNYVFGGLEGMSRNSNGTETYLEERNLIFPIKDIITLNYNYSVSESGSYVNLASGFLTPNITQPELDTGNNSNAYLGSSKFTYTLTYNKVYTRTGTINYHGEFPVYGNENSLIYRVEEQNVTYTDTYTITFLKDNLSRFGSSSPLLKTDKNQWNESLYSPTFDFIRYALLAYNRDNDNHGIAAIGSPENIDSNSSQSTAIFSRVINSCAYQGVNTQVATDKTLAEYNRKYYSFPTINSKISYFYRNAVNQAIALDFSNSFHIISSFVITEEGNYTLTFPIYFAGNNGDSLRFHQWKNTYTRTYNVETESDDLTPNGFYDDPGFSEFWDELEGNSNITIISYNNALNKHYVCEGIINSVQYNDIQQEFRQFRELVSINLTILDVKTEDVFYLKEVNYDYPCTHIFSKNCNCLLLNLFRDPLMSRYTNLVDDILFVSPHINSEEKITQKSDKNYVDAYQLIGNEFRRLPNRNKYSKINQVITPVVGNDPTSLTTIFNSYYPWS